MAQIAAEIRRGHVKHPGQVKIKDFLMQLRPPEDVQKKIEHSKKAWAQALNLDIKKN